MVFAGALCYAELGCVMKSSGGEYAFMYAAFGAPIAFVYAWTHTLLMKCGSIATNALVCSKYILISFFQDGCGDVPEYVVKPLGVLILCKRFGVLAVKSFRLISVVDCYRKRVIFLHHSNSIEWRYAIVYCVYVRPPVCISVAKFHQNQTAEHRSADFGKNAR